MTEATNSLSGAPSVGWRWYFEPKARTLVTAPLAVWLTYCLVVSLAGGGLLWWASLRAAWAVGGIRGVAWSLAFLGILYFFPPVAYFTLFGRIPGVWRNAGSTARKLSVSVGLIVATSLAASVAYRGGVLMVGWIADHDPCAAYAAGVTGSMPPVNCPTAR